MRVKLLASSLMLLSLAGLTVSAQTISIDRERNRGRLMLKEIKDDLKRNYYDPTFRGIDIEARFKQAEERIKTATRVFCKCWVWKISGGDSLSLLF